MMEAEMIRRAGRLPRNILCGLTAFVLTFSAITAQGEQTRDGVDVIEVIGSRALLHDATDSTVPVEVVTGDQLRAAGAVGNELGEALALVAPSFNFPRQSNSVTSDHVRAAQLRGMKPDQVLVLVNGQRRHVSAVVNDNTKIGRGTNAFDFNTIPLSAVKRVEILRDGASAQYGSDAIAGVINIVLDDDAENLVLGASYGLHHTRVRPIDRTLTDGHNLSTWLSHGHRLAGDGFVRYGIEATRRSATNRAGFDQVSPFIPQTDANLAFRGQRTHRVGDPEVDGIGLWINAARPLATVELYGFGTLAWRDTEGAAVFRHPDTNQNVREIFPDGFRPVTRGRNLDFGLTGGVRHEFGAWSFDHALSLGHNRFEFGVNNSLNPSLGPASPTSFDSGTFEFSQLNFSNEARHTLQQGLFSRRTHLAAGLDYRFERFESSPGQPASHASGDFRFAPDLAELVGFPDIGSQGAKGLSPEDATTERRHVIGLFAEVSTELTERFETSIAGRFEHYDDFGSTLTGKLSGRYRVSDEVALRGSASNSFRAPSLSQVGWARRDNTFSAEGGRISSRLVRSGSPIATALGLPELEEETSVNLSAGLVWSSPDGFSLSADAFEIRLDDRITLSDFVSDPDLIEFVNTLPGGEGVQAIAAFTNAVDTRTRGVEAAAAWTRVTDHGQWRLDSAWTRARTRIRSIAPIPAEMAALNPDIALVGVGERNTIETASPEHEWITSLNWQGQRFEVLGRYRYYSSVVREFTFARQRFSGQSVFDVELGYRITPNWSATLGANNLFDQYPDASASANNFFGNFAYDPINPVGINGRFIHIRSQLTF